jgi:hypothetical protein
VVVIAAPSGHAGSRSPGSATIIDLVDAPVYACPAHSDAPDVKA